MAGSAAKTRLKATLNRSISECVPTVTRTYVGQTGQGRPTKMFCAAKAEITSLAGRFTSNMKQLDCEAM
jgi:hypothetical protein